MFLFLRYRFGSRFLHLFSFHPNALLIFNPEQTGGEEAGAADKERYDSRCQAQADDASKGGQDPA